MYPSGSRSRESTLCPRIGATMNCCFDRPCIKLMIGKIGVNGLYSEETESSPSHWGSKRSTSLTSASNVSVPMSVGVVGCDGDPC
jgi:hypothetical protein